MKKFGESYKSSEGKERAEVSGEIGFFELNDRVKIKGVKGEWYFLGEEDEKCLVSSAPSFRGDEELGETGKIARWVKKEDLEKID